MIISAFPGTGKTYFAEHTKLPVMDSDSSKFSWIEEGVRNPEFPDNYMRHIRKNIGKAKVILVSTHEAVRKALVYEGLKFVLVYPDIRLRAEYLERFKQRGSSDSFIKLLTENWSTFIQELVDQQGCERVLLGPGEFISDFVATQFKE